MEHIVVCGYSRSGTTMFYNMLRNSVSNYMFFDREIGASQAIGLSDENVITKSPLDIFKLNLICEKNIFNKKIKLLILIRDIRSILTSYHSAVPDDYFIAYDLQYSPDYNGNALYKTPGVIPTAKAIEQATKNINVQSIIIRYEDLILAPRAQEERIRDFTGIALKERFENFHNHPAPERLTRQLNGQRPLDHTRLDAWKKPEHAQRIRSQFTRCPALFDLLIQYGYEKNREWFEPYRRNRLSR